MINNVVFKHQYDEALDIINQMCEAAKLDPELLVLAYENGSLDSYVRSTIARDVSRRVTRQMQNRVSSTRGYSTRGYSTRGYSTSDESTRYEPYMPRFTYDDLVQQHSAGDTPEFSTMYYTGTGINVDTGDEDETDIESIHRPSVQTTVPDRHVAVYGSDVVSIRNPSRPDWSLLNTRGRDD